MDRVNGARTIDIGGGRRGFRSQNLAAGLDGTEVTAGWLNDVQENLAKVIEGAGLALAASDWTLLERAIRLTTPGRLINLQVFGTPGTFAYAPTAGTRSIIVEVQGAGGAGGGGVNQATGSQQASPGGSGGCYALKRISAGFTGAIVTVGARGLGAVGAPGGAGGTSSFGTFVSAIGGHGGFVGPGVSSGVALTGDTTGREPGTSGDINLPGENGLGATLSHGNSIRAGTGGGSRFGSGGVGNTTPPGGTSADASRGRGYGAGGGGSFGLQGNSVAGADGAPGLVLVWEYA